MFVAACTKGVSLEVTNETGAPISNIQVTFVGGSVSFPVAEPNLPLKARINPVSESNLVLTYIAEDGQVRSNAIDVYIERNYRGSVGIAIRPAGEVQIKDRTRL